MAITSFQAGTITLTTSDTSVSDTLSTTVTQSNSIVLSSLSGGDTRAARFGVRVALNGAGTQVTATRAENGGLTSITVAYQVCEAPEFTVQHITHTQATTSDDITITSVDTDYTWTIDSGTSLAGGFLSNDDFAASQVTTATNLNIQSGGTGGITQIQVVEMSADEIASIQLLKVAQTLTTNDTTITSIDTAKSLMFCSLISTFGGGINGNSFPVASLTSSTNLRTTNRAAQTTNVLWVYVVEFVNLPVTHNTATISTVTTTEVLGGAPTSGGALINCDGSRFCTANTGTDDSSEFAFNAQLSGSTWTFTRLASTVDADISYSVFDWADIFGGGGPVIPVFMNNYRQRYY